MLALRFQSDVTQTVQPNLEAIDDLQHLKQLHRTAVLADRLEDFQQVLAENGMKIAKRIGNESLTVKIEKLPQRFNRDHGLPNETLKSQRLE